ncbi:hypothetical protein BKA62DRAFT_264252 [Auriculariales sp. MPI-PUGE-AT-0066]|nr:hypothetical protein BKA62DRAFT_264252 [Auriculariales sp. MPI-PUGE-AT-0066]
MRPSLLNGAALSLVVAAVAAQQPISVDDTDKSITYWTPSGQWTYHTDQPAQYNLYQNSDTFTSTQGAYIQWSFKGSSIEYWGNTGSYHGPCLVEVDDKAYGNISSHADSTGPPISLFRLDGMNPSVEHTIKITVMADAFPNVCEIDRFVYTPAPNATSTTGSPTPTKTAPTSPKSSPPWGIIGGAVGGGVGGGIILLGFLIWWCRRRQNKKDFDEFIDKHPTNPATSRPQQQNLFQTRPTHRPSASVQSAGSSTRPSSAHSPTYSNSHNGKLHSHPLPPAVTHIPLGPPTDPRTSHYGSELSYGPTSPASTISATRPLLVHNHTSSNGSSDFYGGGYAPAPPVPVAQTMPAHPLSPGRRPTFVLSAASELGTNEPVYPDEKRRPEQPAAAAAGRYSTASSSGTGAGPSVPMPAPHHQHTPSTEEPQAPRPTSASASPSGSRPSTAAAAATGSRPLVQHIDGGTAAPAVTPDAAEELPPAYNEQWQSQQ